LPRPLRAQYEEDMEQNNRRTRERMLDARFRLDFDTAVQAMANNAVVE
jgi:hypothetical protein